MKYIILIIILCGALVTAFISQKSFRLSKASAEEMAVYAILFYGLFSFGKMLTGYRHYTLLQSFAEAGVRTILLYAAGMIFCAAVFVFIRKKTARLITGDFGWWFIPFVSCAYLLSGSVTNFAYCSCLAAAVLFDFIFSSKEKETCISKKKLLQVLICTALFWGVTFLLYVPTGIVLLNLTEIPVKYSWILPVSLIYAVCSVLLACLIGWILPAFFCEWYIVMFFAVTLAGYVQNNFLNGRLSLMDGKSLAFDTDRIVINILLWILIIMIVLVLFYIKKDISLKAVQFISLFFLVTQLLTMGVVWATTDYSVQQADATLTREYITSFDRENSVLVFVLDWFDHQIMDELEAQEPDLLDPLKDFTYYENTVSCYGFTNMSMPYLLSGVKWQNGMDDKDYISYANENGNFLKHLDSMGCSVQLYTNPSLVSNGSGAYVRNYTSEISYDYDLYAFIKYWSKCARFNLLPFAVKENYVYASGDLENVITGNNVYKCSNDTLVYKDITNDGISVTDHTGGQFKLIHLFGAHHPYRMTKDYTFHDDADNIPRNEQAEASFRIAFEYITQLKKAGIYDDMTIIITADHGQNYFNDIPEMKKDGLRPTSSPILFVKKAGEAHDTMIRSLAPVSHEEFIPTVLKALGDDAYGEFGRSFDEIGETEERTRYFIYGRTPDIPYVRYAIRGNVTDEASWELEEIE